jgi:hypothetical protein
MTTALLEAPETDVELLNFPECTFSTTGLLIPEGMEFERWQDLGGALRKAGKGIQFWIGDWIRYGEHQYGEKYTQAIEATGKAEKTLRNYVFVAQNLDLSRRRDTDLVDYSIQAEVAGLKPAQQEAVLQKAEDDHDHFTVKHARREISRIKRSEGKEKTELEVIHTAEVQEFLQLYVDTLKRFEESVPLTARFLRAMLQNHAAQAFWQKNRTIADDCEVILQAVDEGGTIAEDDLYTWLQTRGYFMSDPELDERVEYMLEPSRKMLSRTDAGEGKQDNRRGKLPSLLTRWFPPRPESWGKHQRDEDDEDA